MPTNKESYMKKYYHDNKGKWKKYKSELYLKIRRDRLKKLKFIFQYKDCKIEKPFKKDFIVKEVTFYTIDGCKYAFRTQKELFENIICTKDINKENDRGVGNN